jgi:hypothetical protein
MRLARFLADLRRRNRLQIPTEIDPSGIILTRMRSIRMLWNPEQVWARLHKTVDF